MTSKNVVFDVVGTLSGYDKFFEAIDKTLGDRLRAEGVGIQAFAFLWIETTGREYTNISMIGRYTPSSNIFRALFWRILYQVGIAEPRKFATEDDLTAILKGYSEMEMRPGAKECVRKLRDAGFTVWGLTTGDANTVRSYFTRSGIEMPVEHLKSCDSIGITKPEPDSYKPTMRELGHNGGQLWFAASHLWDVSAARSTGFRGAYCTLLEGEALLDLFGDMDVVAETLPEMADKIIAATSQ